MTAGDFDTFFNEFKRLSAALDPYKRTPADTAAKADAYFHALKRLTITEVIAKADAWLATADKFPKPAQWAEQIIHRAAPPLPVLSASDVTEYLRAETLRHEDDPCGCRECREAEVSDKPLRFVPEFTPDDRDRKVRCGERIVTAGHWAHGYELARFYQARADFWNRCVELGLLTKKAAQTADKVSVEKRLEQIFAKRKAMV